MHFAYPPRKNSNAPAFPPRSSRLPVLRRSRTRVLASLGLFVIAVLMLLTRSHHQSNPWMTLHNEAKNDPNSGSTKSNVAAVAAAGVTTNSFATFNYASSGKAPTVVIVTVFDETNFHRAYLDTVRDNRKLYAERHGYAAFFPKVGEYDLKGSPLSWTKVVAMRHALTLFPDSTFFWFVEQDTFIMNMGAKIESDLMMPTRLEALMIKDHPVVPPDSIIKTFVHLRGQDVDFVLTQDNDGLSTSSFIIRNGGWARFFFETWFDPIYRSYNFQKAETHALEHIVQWHPTILSKMAIVPQRTINAYSKNEHGAVYEPGDLSVRVVACIRTSSTICENEAQSYIKQWQAAARASS
ncbi:alpha-mannosyltransferase [Grosmannia clavigera kw1407]|uniref:Alpha-mannosyltransferase n=1 Tax=Grosmannia clavigera (strain kw1407 / UAMH 11150) TaxID=655863 RepID=F0XTU8_GROCL|nr:alpha-mannosyltransferase [Grosmannia clavigera kw1407]EFW98829.1 alpha-mannosyltransferase [Grosmannia clavigera kw1407]